MTIKKSLFFGLLALVFFAPIPWLYFSPPDFLAGQPLSFYALFFFLSGLSSAALAFLFVLRGKGMSIRAARLYVVLFLVLGAGAYQYSGLAPSFDCFGKKLYVTVADAAGKNCTTTCTSNDVKPCSGWSTCWDKFVSCNSAGKDQDGRNCQGCCFSCKVVCEEPDPPPAQPPTIIGSVSCSQTGSNGWCTGNATLNLTASDPQNYTLTISGNIGGTPFTCAAGKICNKALPDGNGTIAYTVVASQSGKTASGSTTWKRDTKAPVVTPVVPSPTGSNGWFVASPVSVSVNGSDALSGLASAELSVNGGAWQSNASLTTDGVHSLNFKAVDKAGNVYTVAGTVSIDQIAPDVSVNVLGTTGSNGWYVSQTTVTADATDAMSGVASILISDNGGAGHAGPVILDGGAHNLTITATDNAGNRKSVSRSVYVDIESPSITPSITGSSGSNGWYVSVVDVSASAADAVSGVQGDVEVSLDNGVSWSGLPVALTDDGVHSLIFRAYDKAGNAATTNMDVKVDT
ncbi:MAG TPA: Ig-like domain repeat protein, partial [Anaerolineales bacterium]|nr:Ig-like domain repeat protein [Anaerolineales bacterium]